MNVNSELTAAIRTVTTILVPTHAAVMQAGVLTLMDSAAMVYRANHKYDN